MARGEEIVADSCSIAAPGVGENAPPLGLTKVLSFAAAASRVGRRAKGASSAIEFKSATVRVEDGVGGGGGGRG